MRFKKENETLKFHFLRAGRCLLEHCLLLKNIYFNIVKGEGVPWGLLPIREWVTTSS